MTITFPYIPVDNQEEAARKLYIQSIKNLQSSINAHYLNFGVWLLPIEQMMEFTQKSNAEILRVENGGIVQLTDGNVIVHDFYKISSVF